jgi:deoxyribose-phosphate aldolase
MEISSYIDHTILKPVTTIQNIEQLCAEAVEYKFAAVCVPPPFVKRAATILAPVETRVATVAGFPFGYAPTESKIAETVLALVDGADEIDMVINLVALRMNDWNYLENEVRMMTDICHQKNKIIKVIIESGILTDEEIIRCCEVFGPLGIDYMKTSTGYAEKGATIEAVQLMRKHLPSVTKIKASGGIKTFSFAKALIAAGADRLGCSAGVEIVKEAMLA